MTRRAALVYNGADAEPKAEDTVTKRKAPGSLLPRGGRRDNSGRPSMYRNKTSRLITRVRPQTLAKLQYIAAHQAMSVSDALELVVERIDAEVTFGPGAGEAA
jgi:hypothetical protein